MTNGTVGHESCVSHSPSFAFLRSAGSRMVTNDVIFVMVQLQSLCIDHDTRGVNLRVSE